MSGAFSSARWGSSDFPSRVFGTGAPDGDSRTDVEQSQNRLLGACGLFDIAPDNDLTLVLSWAWKE
jgi:hypothetical protein